MMRLAACWLALFLFALAPTAGCKLLPGFIPVPQAGQGAPQTYAGGNYSIGNSLHGPGGASDPLREERGAP